MITVSAIRIQQQENSSLRSAWMAAKWAEQVNFPMKTDKITPQSGALGFLTKNHFGRKPSSGVYAVGFDANSRCFAGSLRKFTNSIIMEKPSYDGIARLFGSLMTLSSFFLLKAWLVEQCWQVLQVEARPD